MFYFCNPLPLELAEDMDMEKRNGIPHLQPKILHYIAGLFGFDGKMKWYVSMRRLDGYLLNLSGQKLIGENNYALAA